MANRIIAAVAVQRELIEGVGVQKSLHAAIARFATAQLYAPGTGNRQIEQARREVLRLAAREYFPYARRVGLESAEPILTGLGGEELVAKGTTLRSEVLRRFRRYHKANVRVLASRLREAAGELSGAAESAFLEAERDGISRKRLLRDLVESDKGELKRLKAVREEIADTAGDLRKAESRLARSSKRQQVRARRKVREARKKHVKAKAKVGTTKSFLARFETRCQAHIRDAVRREAQRSQFSAFEQAGYKTFAWVAVNGTDACPSCVARHRKVHNRAQWQQIGMPGDGKTYCGAACMCHLVPQAYVSNNPSLLRPISAAG